jgi:hypothetical protein
MVADSDDDETKLQLRPDLEKAFEGLRDDSDAFDELVVALKVPTGIDPTPYAQLVAGVMEEVIRRAGLELADRHDVALHATPESLFALVDGTGGAELLEALKPGVSRA